MLTCPKKIDNSSRVTFKMKFLVKIGRKQHRHTWRGKDNNRKLRNLLEEESKVLPEVGNTPHDISEVISNIIATKETSWSQTTATFKRVGPLLLNTQTQLLLALSIGSQKRVSPDNLSTREVVLRGAISL